MFEATLAPEVRLALAYAPAAVRPLQLAAFALDARLAGIVGSAREVLIAQIKLAWWRERLAEQPEARPVGEPLLAALAAWQGPTDPLIALVDGWEAMLDPEHPAPNELARSRAELGAGLAIQAGVPLAAEAGGAALRAWSLATCGVSDPAACGRLPRALRALAVLQGLARRRGGDLPLLDGPLALAAAIRLGMVGR